MPISFFFLPNINKKRRKETKFTGTALTGLNTSSQQDRQVHILSSTPRILADCNLVTKVYYKGTHKGIRNTAASNYLGLRKHDKGNTEGLVNIIGVKESLL